VFSDVGPVSFACMRWPGAETCSGALLMERAGADYVLRSGLHVGDSADQIRTFRVLDAGLPTDMLLGALPAGAVSAMVTLGGEREIRARTSEIGAVGGKTLWWLSVTEPVRAVTFLDAKYGVVDEVVVGD
jgi:hypothetical protein